MFFFVLYAQIVQWYKNGHWRKIQNKNRNKDNDSYVQSEADSKDNGDSKTFDGFAKSSARNEKWIQCTECLMWAHVECLDAGLTCMFANTANEYQFWTFCVIFFPESVFVPLLVYFEKLNWMKDVHNVRQIWQTIFQNDTDLVCAKTVEKKSCSCANKLA